MTLPSPSVAAPPPSTDLSADVRRLASGSVPDPGKAVVPPPPTSTSTGSFMGSLMGRIFGPSEVVAPPPSVTPKASPAVAPSLPTNVVPPPPAAPLDAAQHATRSGLGTQLEAKVIAPPSSTGVTGGTGRSRTGSAPYLGNAAVVPPPPSLSGAGGGTGTIGGGAGSPTGTLAANVIPPPPSVSGGTSPAGSGLGRKALGLGAPLDPGIASAPTNNAGSGKDAGTIVSSQPGSKVGVPPNEKIGSLAMSPAGGDKPGLGGAGGGTSIARGDGSGSSLSGSGTGAAKNGAGHGSEPNARGGISPSSGPGGAGNSAAGTPAVRGVDISGGSGVVTLPSFGSGSDPAPNDPSAAGHPPVHPRSQTLGVTVVATSTSGGAFAPYKNLLRGDKYTTYFETSLGTVVMEFADQSASSHSFGGALNAPTAIRTDLAEGLPHARMVITCTLDAAGNVKNPRVLEAGPAGMTAKILAALPAWKFQPAMRADQPVEVTAILGFGINTDDRF